MNYGIRAGYKIRPIPEYFPDVQADGKIWQGDVYKTAAILAWKFGAQQLVDIGCGHGDKLIQYAGEFNAVGIDTGENIIYCQTEHPSLKWLDINIEQRFTLVDYAGNAVFVCSDVIEHLKNPSALIACLKDAIAVGTTIVLSTPDRQRWHGYDHNGEPVNTAHVREWTLAELVAWLKGEGLPVAWSGWTKSNNVDAFVNTCIVILSQREVGVLPLPLEPAPQAALTVRPDVSVLIPAYNAEKTITAAIFSALDQCGVSVEVVVCNDASTDTTGDIVKTLQDKHPQIVLVNHAANQGLAPALNGAAGIATGRYFVELDADDWLQTCSLKRLVEALDNNPGAGFAYGQTQYHGLSDYLHTPQAYREHLFLYGFDSLYAFMYRREAWDAGCRYHSTCVIDGRTVTIQDWDMALQLVYHMRYQPVVLRDMLVLNYNHVHGSLTDFTTAHNGQVVKAFRGRWPMVAASQI